MPPKTLDKALRTLIDQDGAYGLLSARVEAACDEATAAVIAAYGEVLGSKSKAIRSLLKRGAAALYSDQA